MRTRSTFPDLHVPLAAAAGARPGLLHARLRMWTNERARPAAGKSHLSFHLVWRGRWGLCWVLCFIDSPPPLITSPHFFSVSTLAARPTAAPRRWPPSRKRELNRPGRFCLPQLRPSVRGGRRRGYSPAPTFTFTATALQEEQLVPQCTSSRPVVLTRINAVIAARIAAGEDLPPPSKTADARSEYLASARRMWRPRSSA